ncbi:glycosyl transferase [Pseudoalteromonas sp. P1-8]|uniref:glycosyl transferase n=1 Tax=Pseudoalteromonas sp. P1-8 TaxID=1710353 RepID=UPI0006E593C4|nr:glycosyl transferase [Pseudoalteromonas sp. P1-8]KPV96911.1 hypothetical protein AN213_03877 [Pseudoalteromonas sp. P1-8]
MSQSYNTVERHIARFLSKFPIVKVFIKNVYSRIVFFKAKKGYKIKSNNHMFYDAGAGTFFGYYDKSPLNCSGKYLILHEHSNTKLAPKNFDEVTVALRKFPNGETLARFKTKAFNWQQGSKLQWLNDDLFIFNDYDSNRGKYCSRIVSSNDRKQVKQFELPIYDCYSDSFALTLNFERLAVLSSDYGYFANKKKVTHQALPDNENDGIFYLDLKSGESKLTLSLKEIIAFETQINMDESLHTVNHIMISPGGERYMFIHRWYHKGQRFDRLILADLDGNMKVVSNNDMVSHCFWKSNNEIFGYLRGSDGIDAYWVINVDNNCQKIFNHPNLRTFGDGHPNIKNDYFITDTYPDKARMQKLILGHLNSKLLIELGEFYHGFDYNLETRCDLHPRFSSCGNFVLFDTVYSGQRKLCCYEMTDDLKRAFDE